ncbi:MAG: substrate-binding domain-containing protein [Planctomycetes bacterium]|nr:substrate-binding domain-containing protein [Planctomycetota bacterium]
MTNRETPYGRAALATGAALVLLAVLYALFWRPSDESLVVYCAHDSVYSEAILKAFEKETSLTVAVRFDTEATKSLGLVELLKREAGNPRCDVFWNNEILGTMDLAGAGILHPYKGPGYERIPAAYKDPEGLWTGFGARLRVYIINTDGMKQKPAVPLEKNRSIYDDPYRLLPAAGTRESAPRLLLLEDLSRAAIAKPLYGTTLTQYCVMWDRWSGDALKQWHYDARSRGLRELAGNATVKEAVAEGRCDIGFTDTDDYFVARAAGKPVIAMPVRLDGAVIAIPNTVCIIRGTKRAAQAERLVDYILSQKTETALARSGARQVPLGPVDKNELPEEVRELLPYVKEGYPLASLGKVRVECIDWLKGVYSSGGP